MAADLHVRESPQVSGRVDSDRDGRVGFGCPPMQIAASATRSGGPGGRVRRAADAGHPARPPVRRARSGAAPREPGDGAGPQRPVDNTARPPAAGADAGLARSGARARSATRRRHLGGRARGWRRSSRRAPAARAVRWPSRPSRLGLAGSRSAVAGFVLTAARAARRASACAASAWSSALAFFLPAAALDAASRRHDAWLALSALEALVLRASGSAWRCRCQRQPAAGRCGSPRLWVAAGGAARTGCRSAASPGAGSRSRQVDTPLAARWPTLGGAPLVTFAVAAGPAPLLAVGVVGAARSRSAGRAAGRRRSPRSAAGAASRVAGRWLLRAAADRRTATVTVGRGAGQRARRRAATSTPSAGRHSTTTSTATDRAGRAGRGRASARSRTSSSGRRTPPTSTRSATPTPTPRSSRPRSPRSACPILVGAVARRARPGDVLEPVGIVWDPATGAGEPLHQAAPGAVRRVHPAAGRFFRHFSRPGSTRSPRDFAAGHAAGRARRRPARRSATSICFEVAYDDWSATASTRRRRAARRADQQRDVRPHRRRPTSSSRSPGCGRSSRPRRSRVAATVGVIGARSRPDGTVRRREPACSPRPCSSSAVALRTSADPGDADRAVAGAAASRSA